MERLRRGHLHLPIQRVTFFNGFEFNQLRGLNAGLLRMLQGSSRHGHEFPHVRNVDVALPEGTQRLFPGFTQLMGHTNLQIAAQETSGIAENEGFHVRRKQFNAHHGSDPNGQTCQEEDKLTPTASDFPPRHQERNG